MLDLEDQLIFGHQSDLHLDPARDRVEPGVDLLGQELLLVGLVLEGRRKGSERSRESSERSRKGSDKAVTGQGKAVTGQIKAVMKMKGRGNAVGGAGKGSEA